MTLKTEKFIQEDETRAAGFIWTMEDDPTWLRWQVDFTTGAMKGYHISRCNGMIPRVTPFKYDFNRLETAKKHHEIMALVIFADIGPETLIEAESKPVENNIMDQIGAWQDFRNAFGDTTEKPDVVAVENRVVSYDGNAFKLPNNLVIIKENGALSMPLDRNYKTGERLSGFDAFKIAGSRELPKGLQPGYMGDIDIKQAQSALSHVERPSSHAVAWYGTGDSEQAKYRCQAATAMPILAGLLADRPSLADAVDEMRPINPILMDMTGLAKAAVRRIGKLTIAAPANRIFEDGEQIDGEDALGVNRVRHTQVSGSVPLDMALRYLSALPPDRTPNDNESWLKFNDILSAVALPIHNALSIPVATILEASRGNWIQYHENMARAADFTPENFDRQSMALTVIDALEAMEHFNRTIILPQALVSISNEGETWPKVNSEFIRLGFRATSDFILGKSKNTALLLMEISRRYASRIPAMMEIEGRDLMFETNRTDTRFKSYPENGFPVLTEDFNSSNGLVARPLRNGDELVRESRRLKHCIGSYQNRARRTKSHIYSIQNHSGSTSYSTFEISAVKGEENRTALNSLYMVQHRGDRNSTPAENCMIAEQEFMDALKAGEIDINLSEIDDWRNWLKQKGDIDGGIDTETTWKSMLEFDWTAGDSSLEYWKEWGQVLGGKVAASPHSGIVYSEPATRALLHAMSPRTAMLMNEKARQKSEQAVIREDGPQF